jgi:hypothetical protein
MHLHLLWPLLTYQLANHTTIPCPTRPHLFLYYSRSSSIPVLTKLDSYGPLAQVSIRHPPTATNKQEFIIIIRTQ